MNNLTNIATQYQIYQLLVKLKHHCIASYNRCVWFQRLEENDPWHLLWDLTVMLTLFLDQFLDVTFSLKSNYYTTGRLHTNNTVAQILKQKYYDHITGYDFFVGWGNFRSIELRNDEEYLLYTPVLAPISEICSLDISYNTVMHRHYKDTTADYKSW